MEQSISLNGSVRFQDLKEYFFFTNILECMGRGHIHIAHGLLTRLPHETTQMPIQACLATPQCLSLRNSVSLNFKWRGGLEIKHHCKIDPTWHTKATERWAQYWESSTIRTLQSIQVSEFTIPRNNRNEYLKKAREFAASMKKAP